MTLPLIAPAAAAEAADPYLWLEDISSDQALAWVRERNAAAEQEFAASPRFEPMREQMLKVLDSREKIPLVDRIGAHYYNLWQDDKNPRGLWRRVRIADYALPEPPWETVLDIDALGKSEKENWVFHDAECLRPARDGEPYRRCMISLSRGGSDAAVLREFDLGTRQFVAGGFVLSEAKQGAIWKDADTLWVTTDFGPNSMTSSGYPRIVKEWQRGKKLAGARPVYEGRRDDVGVEAFTERESGVQREWVVRDIAFWNTEYFLRKSAASRSADNSKSANSLIKLDVPGDARPSALRDWLLVRTRSPWTVGGHTYPGGALLAIKFDAFQRGARAFDVLYEPGEGAALRSVSTTRNAIVLSELDNVRSRLWELRHADGGWQRTRVATPDNAQISVTMTDWSDDDYHYTIQDFTTPTTLRARRVGAADSIALKSLPSFFDAAGLVTQQFRATSRDGTAIPYFLVMREGTTLNGANPTLLDGYGGFEISELPHYSGLFGLGWLQPGGVFAVANLRGGGEFGPEWHRAAQKENKQRTWDDMAAVAEDLIRRGITSPPHLGIMGGSQGGLLVTATMWQRPELFKAVVAQVPLTDMLRYHKLLAGASWIAEYGDPEVPAERAYIEKYSPYQNVKRDVSYPRIFLVTSTRDDRVHPAHARKLAARLLEQGHDVLYYENIEGGHSAGADNPQRARMWAQAFTFLWRELQ